MTKRRRPKQPRRHRHEKPRPSPARANIYEVEVAPGLEAVAQDELLAYFAKDVHIFSAENGTIRIRLADEAHGLLGLRTVQSVYHTQHYPIPRPKALLGDQHFRALLRQIALVRELHPADAFESFYIGAAGSHTSVMQRIKSEVAQHTGLTPTEDEGDLHLRIRPASHGTGWETLVRLTPRPLATRAWRLCSFEGALNAAVARAMIRLTQPGPKDVFLNLMCGSGTLLIERANDGPAAFIIGCDTDPHALDCAHINLRAAGHTQTVNLETWDATDLPLGDAMVDALVADLPFGNLTGSHQENVALYPAVLREAARVALPGARFVVITHEVRLMTECVSASDEWRAEDVLRVWLGGLHPRIFVLQRADV